MGQIARFPPAGPRHQGGCAAGRGRKMGRNSGFRARPAGETSVKTRICHGCGAPIGQGDPVPREASCPACGRDLRCCRNCRHWDERASDECRETEAERVTEKWRRNFCEYFEWSPAPFVAGQGGDRAADARARLDALFRKPGPPAD